MAPPRDAFPCRPPGLRACLAALLLAAAATPLLALERLDRDASMSAVIERPAAASARDVATWAAALPPEQRADLLAAHYGRTGAWDRLYAEIAQPAMRRQELLAADRFLAATCAEACIRDGHPNEAQELLDRLAWDGSGCGIALGWAARARLVLGERGPEAAGVLLRRARSASEAKGSDEGSAWLRAVTRQRLEALQRDIAASVPDPRGPDQRAWVAAERLAAGDGRPEAVIAAYEAVAALRPTGRFAAPATLEALRWRGRSDDAAGMKEGLKALLARHDPQLHGFACLLAADAALRSGPDLEAARRLADEALGWAAAVGDGDPAGVPEDARSPRPPHRFDRRGYPGWEARETGRLWTLDAAPWAKGYVSVQALVRLAAVAFLAGDRAIAAGYVNGIPMLDPIDAEMAAKGRPAGPAILAAALSAGGDFTLPLASWQDLPPPARTRVAMAVFSYELYDWRGAREWLAAAQRCIPEGDRRHRNALQHLTGLTWYAEDDPKRALACWAAVQVGRSETPTGYGPRPGWPSSASCTAMTPPSRLRPAR